MSAQARPQHRPARPDPSLLTEGLAWVQGGRAPRLRLDLVVGDLRQRRADAAGLVGLADRARQARHDDHADERAPPDGDGDGRDDDGPPQRRALHARARRVRPAGRRGLVRRAVRQAAGAHARVRRDRARRRRPARAGQLRRPALPAAARRRPRRRHRPRQAAEVDPAPAARAHPDVPRRPGTQEHRLGRRDRRRLAAAVLLARTTTPSCTARAWRRASPGAAARPTDFEIAPSVPFIVDDDVERAADTLRPMYALYFGGMGAREHELPPAGRRSGWATAPWPTKIQDLYLDGKKDEAAAAVPTKLIEELALIGPADKIRHDLEAWRASPRHHASSSPVRQSGCARPRSCARLMAAPRPHPARRRARDRHGRWRVARCAGATSPTSAPTSSGSSRRAARRRAGRRRCTTGVSLPFAINNAGKRSVVADLATAEGRERLLQLLDGADIWIETARPGALAALGLGADVARAQPAPRRALDHRLRPDRPLPRLGGDRRDAAGDGRRAEPRPACPAASR